MHELSGVSEAARDRAMARFRMIQPYLEKRRSLQLFASDANLISHCAEMGEPIPEARTSSVRAEEPI
jgi:hypothetical protein